MRTLVPLSDRILLLGLFVERHGLKAQSMDALAHLVGEDAVYFTMPCDRAHADKDWTDDVYAEMRFAQGVVSSVTRVQMRIIRYFQNDRRKRLVQFPLDPCPISFSVHVPNVPLFLIHEQTGDCLCKRYLLLKLWTYAASESISSELRMKLGMLGCGEQRKTFIASSVIEDMRLMSTKFGAFGFEPGPCE
jgi:hypothetical protein